MVTFILDYLNLGAIPVPRYCWTFMILIVKITENNNYKKWIGTELYNRSMVGPL